MPPLAAPSFRLFQQQDQFFIVPDVHPSVDLINLILE
jgi:hypothetical protein